MGGFAGGDEGGYWDDDSVQSLVEKQNKNKARKSELDIQVTEVGFSIKAYVKEDLYDLISFVEGEYESFIVEGCGDIPLEENSIYKAYIALLDYTNDTDISDFFQSYKVVVTKSIPLHSGLGGASADAIAFMYLVKEVCNLVLSNDELTNIKSDLIKR